MGDMSGDGANRGIVKMGPDDKSPQLGTSSRLSECGSDSTGRGLHHWRGCDGGECGGCVCGR